VISDNLVFPEECRGIALLRCVVTRAQLEAPVLRLYIHILTSRYTGKITYTKEGPLDVLRQGFERHPQDARLRVYDTHET
jgi:hypothetical protein